MDSYLEVARTLLKARGRPMTAFEILAEAEKFNILPPHLRGKTMHKTLQARIAEDIAKNRFRSLFYRTAPGTYFLREMSEDQDILSKKTGEYFSVPRRRAPRSQRVLCIKFSCPATVQLYPSAYASDLAFSESAYYERHSIASVNDGLFRFMTFTIVKYCGKVVCHKVGKYSQYEEVKNNFSIGFRSDIGEFDVDILYDDFIGYRRCALSEVLRHVQFHDKFTDITAYQRMSVPTAIVDGTNRFVSFVVVLDLTGIEFCLKTRSRALDINQPRWIVLQEEILDQFDTWSKFISNEVVV